MEIAGSFVGGRLVIRNRGEMDKKGGDGYESAREEPPKTMLEIMVIRDEMRENLSQISYFR